MSKKTVVLISPPLSAHEQAGSMKSIVNVIPPLGLAYIAATTEKAGYDVRIVDAPHGCLDQAETVRRVVAHNPFIIGVTATVITVHSAQRLSMALKHELPDVRIVLGGPMVTSIPEESMTAGAHDCGLPFSASRGERCAEVTMSEGAFDCGVIGEGEEIFPKLCDMARDGTWDPLSLGGIVMHDGNEWKKTPRPPMIPNLDALPRPAWHLFPPLSTYRPMPAGVKNLPMAHIVSSRGCPFTCVYCDQSVYGTRFRTHSPEWIGEEIERLMRDHGAKEIKFYDDIFNIREKWVLALCDEIIKRKLKITWSCSCRVDLLTERSVAKMKEAGCWQIDLGLESGNPEILESMKKNLTLEDSVRGVKLAQDAGLSVRAFFIVGMPGETKQSMQDTLDLAIRLKLDVATFYALMVYPGNALYDQIKASGKLRHADFSKYSSILDVNDSELHYVPDDLTEEEIKAFISSAYRRFYLRPSYVFQRLRGVRSFKDLAFYVRAGTMILSW